MTVDELIQALQAFPGDAIVTTYCDADFIRGPREDFDVTEEEDRTIMLN